MPDRDFAACSPLNLHSSLASNHDFAARSPINFAACSPPVIDTEGTTRSKNHYQTASENFQIYTLDLNSGKTKITTTKAIHIYLLLMLR